MEIETTKYKLIISISQENTFQLKVQETKEPTITKEIITEKDNNLLAIQFDQNEIFVGQEKKIKQSVKEPVKQQNEKKKKKDEFDFLDLIEEENYFSTFITEMIDNPNDLQWYTFDYQGKEYNLIGESLFGLVINHQRKIIEKNCHIDSLDEIEDIIFELPVDNPLINIRLQRGLQMIGYSCKLSQEEKEQIKQHENSYERQEMLIKEILCNYRIYLKTKKQIIDNRKIMMEEDHSYRCYDLMNMNIHY